MHVNIWAYIWNDILRANLNKVLFCSVNLMSLWYNSKTYVTDDLHICNFKAFHLYSDIFNRDKYIDVYVYTCM